MYNPNEPNKQAVLLAIKDESDEDRCDSEERIENNDPKLLEIPVVVHGSILTSINKPNLDYCNRNILNRSDNIMSPNEDLLDESSDPIGHNFMPEFSVATLNRKLNKTRHSFSKKGQLNTRAIDQSITEYNTPPSIETQLGKSIDTLNLMMNPTTLIEEHLSEIQLRIIGHMRSANMYEKREKIIGYPVTILSSFLSSTIMMTITAGTETPVYIKYISLGLSLTSFLLSVSRDYFGFAKKSQQHDLSSKLYTTLLRSMEVRLIKNHLNKNDKRDMFKDIVDQMSIIEQYETPVPSIVERKIREENTLLNRN
jgi:hypothetical protein